MMWGAFFKLAGFMSGPLSLVAWRSSPVALLAAVPMCLWQVVLHLYTGNWWFGKGNSFTN